MNFFQQTFLSMVERFCIFKEVHLFSVDIDRALTFGYDSHQYFMQLIPKFGKYLQCSLLIT